ncbi:MAG: universal stress protein [Chloroflexi bacterium]|nr:universal stress protein [Chloroflexota bacterium]
MSSREGFLVYKRILVPQDGSAFAERVLPHAIELARRFDAEIHLLEVIPTQTPGLLAPELAVETEPVLALEVLEQVQEALRAAGRERLEGLVSQLERDGVHATWRVVDGDPVPEIISYIEKNEIDLIAMASHGRSGLARAILGSVTDAVLRRGNRPMLVIPVRGD